jgi:SAM-dependent methyltransferase
MWLGNTLLPELGRLGLADAGWALDIGCGTGRAFTPLLTRGWQIVGCDLSTGMLNEARRKFGSRVRLLTLDARFLPTIKPEPQSAQASGGVFHLILLLNDVINYLVEDQDLELLFSSIARNLRRDSGFVIFDANTLLLFRQDFGDDVTAVTEQGLRWCGLAENVVPAGLFRARLSGPNVEAHVHRQRHWLPEQVTTAMEVSGLRTVAILGQREEGGKVVISDAPDEERDAKILYVGTLS